MATDGNSHEQPAADESPQLLQEFPFSTPGDWRQLVEKELKGAPFDKKLVSKTYEGIDLQPIYTQEDSAGLPHLDSLPGFPPYVRGGSAAGYRGQAWAVAQELTYATPAAWNSAARHDLDHGQTALTIVLDAATLQGLDPDQAPADTVGRGGLSLATVDDLAAALDGVDLGKVPLFFQAGSVGVPVAALLAALAQRRGLATSALQGAIAFDPLGGLAQTGSLPTSLARAYDEMAQLSLWAQEHAPQVQTIAVNGQPYHDGGGSAVQELAFALATAVDYIRALQERGLEIDAIAPRIRFAFSVGANFFTELAKLRAARLLWAQIVAAFGGQAEAQKMTLHARTSRWNTTALDPHVNLLRSTVEAFAGVAGSCDSLHVGYFDEAIQPPDEFSRRIARNTHLILSAEAHLSKVVDPAGGSWYVEKLTDDVARRAWELFQTVESKGGMAQALQAGFPQQQIAKIAGQRAAALATRKDILVGTNMYPNTKEKALADHTPDYAAITRERADALASYRSAKHAASAPLDTLRAADAGTLVAGAIAAAAAGATLGEINGALRQGADAGLTITAIPTQRGSAPFEALRAASEAYLAKTGARPRIFLANMGPLLQHKARADFSTAFFQVGGFDVLGNSGFATVEEAAAAAKAADTAAVVICSTDATYPELVPPLAQLIKAERPDTLLILAGYPTDQVESYKAAGIDEFIHLRADVYHVLARVLQTIGVTA